VIGAAAIAVAATALLAGLLGGLTGIGGVIVVPALTEFARVPVGAAIATTMFAFNFSGPLAAYVTLRRVRLGLPPVAVLCVAAGIGSLVGTLTLEWLPSTMVRLFVAAAAAASGWHALVKPDRSSASARLPGLGLLALLGLAVGWGSAVSGTGGPVMLIPILLALGVPTATSVGLGLAAHLPIVAMASVTNAWAGRIDYALGIMLGALLVIGTLGGTWLSGRQSGRQLTLSVAVALIAVGAWYAYTTLAHA
jgi:uncharacterized membrane protein YfcA